MSIEIELTPEQRQELQDRKEHQEAKESVLAILSTNAGRRFIKYLFKNLDVGELPEQGLTDIFLHDRLGFLRSGQAVFKLVAEVDPKAAGMLMAEIEKEKYEKLVQDFARSNAY